MLGYSNYSILETSIFHNYKYFSSFKAGNCVSNSSFEWIKNRSKKFGITRLSLLIDNRYHFYSNSFWEMKWRESGFNMFRPHLCTYSLNWAWRTSWGWWDDAALQTQDAKYKSWRSEAEHATSRSRRLLTILSFTSGWGRNIFVSCKPLRPAKNPEL